MLLRALEITEGTSGGINLDLAAGYFEPPNVRYEDRVIPGAPGLWLGNRVANDRELQLVGWVRGKGSDEEERTADWHDKTVALMAVLDQTLAPGPLVIPAGYLGTPDDRTIEVVTVNLIPGRIRACMSYQTWTVALLAAETLYWSDESS
jgi:hypothetical protein